MRQISADGITMMTDRRITEPFRQIRCYCNIAIVVAAALIGGVCAAVGDPPASSAAITAVTFSPVSEDLVIGRFQSVSIQSRGSSIRGSHPPIHCNGSVDAIAFSPDGRFIAVAGGHTGRMGEVLIVSAHTWKTVAMLVGPDDTVQAVAWSPDGRTVAGGSYDHMVYLWHMPATVPNRANIIMVKPRLTLRDHTDAVYGVSFSRDGTKVASAASDRTVKIWSVATGQRIVTLSESTGELYTVAFKPNGNQIAAAGADRIIRVWDVSSGALLHSGFAHDGAILKLVYSHDGSQLISAGEDMAVKQWESDTLQEAHVFPRQSDWPQAIALSSDGLRLVVGCHNGQLHIYPTAIVKSAATTGDHYHPMELPQSIIGNRIGKRSIAGSLRLVDYKSGGDPIVDRIPGNETLQAAQIIPAPGAVKGALWDGKPDAAVTDKQRDHSELSHYYRFHARRGDPMVIEVNARRSGSPLDSYIQILDTSGRPVEQAVLRALGQSEITLFDKDSAITGIRILPFPDLRLNDYVLIGRELLCVGTLPKGPDDDTQFRSIHGVRVGYLGTTPEYHSIGTKVYRVAIHPAGSTFSPNGMPLTHVMYENDDGGPLYGRDSCLLFSAPQDSDYIVRLTDTRGNSGKMFAYTLSIHAPRPDFRISFNPAVVTVPRAGSSAVTVDCDRLEGFNGPIHVHLDQIPEGFTATESDIEAGETSTTLLVSATPQAVGSTDKHPATFRVVASAEIMGKAKSQVLEVDPGRKLVVGNAPTVGISTDQNVLSVKPGHEVSVLVTIVRGKGFAGRVPLDVRNLPFGVKVNDIGLNGILVGENENARRIVISCEPWVKPLQRPIYIFAGVEGGIGTGAPALAFQVTP